jgi:hypothetical protein
VLWSDSGSGGEDEIVHRPRPRPAHFDRLPDDVRCKRIVAKLKEIAYDPNRRPAEGAKESKTIYPLDPIAFSRKQRVEKAKLEAAKLEAAKHEAAKWNVAKVEPVEVEAPKLEAPKLDAATLKAASLGTASAAPAFPLSSATSHVSVESNSTIANANLSASPPKTELKPKPVAARPGPPLPSKMVAFKKDLLDQFYFDQESIMAENLGAPLRGNDGIYVFVDLSNILHGLEKHIEDRPYLMGAAKPTTTNNRSTPRPMLDFDALSLLMERGRPATRRFMLGTWPPFRSEPFHKMVEKSRKRGYETVIWKKVPQDPVPTKGPVSWKEQGVDEGIQLQIVDAILMMPPGTMVVATGDGARSTLGDGFCSYIEKALALGWKVELMAWGSSTSKKYLDVNWQYQWKAQFHFVDLGDFAAHLFELPVLTQRSPAKK